MVQKRVLQMPQSDKTEMADQVTKPVMRAFRADLLVGGALRGFAFGAAVAACGLLVARAFLSPLPPVAFAVFAVVPVCVLVCALRSLARAPSVTKCLALVEDASHAGGLILAKDVPGAEKWPSPVSVAPPIPITWRRSVPAAIVSLVSLVAVAAAPDDWFAAGVQQPPAPAFPDVTTEIKNELAELEEAKSLDAEDIKALQEELARIEKEADPASPGETLDAVDAVREKLDALLDIDAQAAKRILPKDTSFSTLATKSDAAEQLKKMLDESYEGRCPYCCAKLGDGEGECNGECCAEKGHAEEVEGKPGSGGISRGMDDAAMNYGNEAQLGASKLKDLAEKTELSGKPSETKVGESISEEDPAKHGIHSASGATRAIGGRNRGTSANQLVLPRHRGTVKRFFDIERKTP